MYESLAFKTAVQSVRDMATMMTGGGRTVSNWGGAKSLVELKQAMALLGEGGDNVNRKRLFEFPKVEYALRSLFSLIESIKYRLV